MAFSKLTHSRYKEATQRITAEEKQKLQSGFQSQRGKKTELFKTRLEVFRKEKVQKVNKEIRDEGQRQSLDQAEVLECGFWTWVAGEGC